MARCLDDVRAGAPGAEVSSLLCDFSRQAEVRRLADEVLRRYDRVDVLVNNAGTMFKKRTLTEDGIEATFAVNLCLAKTHPRIRVTTLIACVAR
jgi:NAD(P)-dependent dehydrogenase (short-subunit alcohol dehydrogenase family)